MLTVFSIPKPFRDEFAIIQRNAIQSWQRLDPNCEVILFGSEIGTFEIATDLQLRHVPEVERNEYGTPLVSDLFEKAQKIASNPVLCYVNADIILTRGFVTALRLIHKPHFLMIGRRYNIDIQAPLDFSEPDWENSLIELVKERAKPASVTAIDYFVFPRGFYSEIPRFAIGRYAWDQWLVYYARAAGVPVYDASEMAIAIHQNHGYMESQAREAPETEINMRLASMVKKEFHPFHLYDATHIISQKGIRPALARKYLWRRLMAMTVLYKPLHPFFLLGKKYRKLTVKDPGKVKNK